MNPIRILVVDDSAVMRRFIINALVAHDDLEVIGTASNGLSAIDFVRKSRPDIVILDIEMPVMDGLSGLREIRKFDRTLPIIMFSSLTQRGADSTITALMAGASDYVGKPTNLSDAKEAALVLEQTLIPKIKALCLDDHVSMTERATADLDAKSNDLSRPRRASFQGNAEAGSSNVLPSTLTSPAVTLNSTAHAPVRPTMTGSFSSARIEAVCIGVSTGGPAALGRIFERWTEPLAVPVFIVQHMPAQFTTLLAQKLAGLHNIPVTEAVDGEVVMNGHVYIAPGGLHLALEEIAGRVMIRLTLEPPENFCRPAVDVLFRTAASIYGPRLLGIVLTGMGSDGAKGAMSISRAGGQIIAQDQATSLIWGMPGAVVRAGLAKKIMPLGDVYQELYEHCRARKAVQ